MIEVRDAVTGDLQEILAIYNEAILNTTAVYDYTPHTIDMRGQWFDGKKQQGYPVLVAEENGVIAGFGSLGAFRAWAAYRFTVENAIYIKEGYRGRGIGRNLLLSLINEAKNMQVHTIVAGIDAANETSIQLHVSAGFEEVAHFKQVGWKFEKWLDLKFLQLLLK